ncbi:hypothetical protein ACJJTC_000298 [Scirpophaga incertulas]
MTLWSCRFKPVHPRTKCMEQTDQTDELESLKTGTDFVSHSRTRQQLGLESRDTDSLKLSQVPISKDNLPLFTVTYYLRQKLHSRATAATSSFVTRKFQLFQLYQKNQILINFNHIKQVFPQLGTSASAKNEISTDPNTVFEQHLYIPQPLEKSKQNVSKDRIPSAISGKKWREYHLLKENVKQKKNEEKEKAKEARKQAMKRKQEEAQKNKELNKAKKIKKGTLLKTRKTKEMS